jgi:hypothetical protein
MGTLTLLAIRNNIRSELNETTTTILSDTELNALVNDGYKDVAAKGLCFESKVTKDNIAIEKIVSFMSTNPIRITYAEYKTGATQGGKGMLCTLPQTSGYIPINGSSPQYWFQWGSYLVVEPIPDDTTYDLAVYTSCYPATVRSADNDLLDSLPVEFHECVYLFALAFAALKLRRWGDAANAYNQYIINVQQKRAEFVMKYPDNRYSHELPDNVSMQEQKG